MNDAAVSALRRLAKCLEDTSECLDGLLDIDGTDGIHAQVMSLKLIIDHNREAIQLTIGDAARRKAQLR